jgi:hypothetical protein
VRWKGEGRGLGLKVFIGWLGSHFTLTRIGLKFESQELISTKIYLSPFIHSTMDRNLKYLVDILDECYECKADEVYSTIKGEALSLYT